MQLTPLLASLISDLEDVDGPLASPRALAVGPAGPPSDAVFGDGGDAVAGFAFVPLVPGATVHGQHGHHRGLAQPRPEQQQRARLLSGLQAFEAMLDAWPGAGAEPAAVVTASSAAPPPPPGKVSAKTAIRATAAGGAAHPVVDRNADPRAELARLFPKSILRAEKEVYRAYKNRVRGMTTEMAAELAKLRRREKQCVYAGAQRQRRIETAHAMEAEVEKLNAENVRLRAENAELKAKLGAVGAAGQLCR